jgi:putative PIG3 family NAD(P)H quinone oxidoreductase
MKAVVIQRDQQKGRLSVQELPDPPCPYGCVRLAVYATSVNRADILQVRGLYPGDYQIHGLEIPGLECAGVIDALGDGVTGWQKGDRVFALLPGGGYAQQAIVPASMLMPVPDNLGFVEAAAVPEAFFTAYDAMTQAEIAFGEAILVHAAASGVGTAAFQLAQAWGLTVFGTADSKKVARLRDAGLSARVVAYDEEEFAKVIPEMRPQGVDVILDLVGGDYVAPNLDVLASQGRIVQIGLLRGSTAEVPLQRIMLKRAKLIGTMLRLRSMAEKSILTARFTHKVLPLLAESKVRPIIDQVFAMEEVEKAHRYVKDGHNLGKVVLEVRRAAAA